MGCYGYGYNNCGPYYGYPYAGVCSPCVQPCNPCGPYSGGYYGGYYGTWNNCGPYYGRRWC